MNIFIIGQSGTGKTPIAKLIAKEKGMNHIKGSEYFRKAFKTAYKDRNKFIKEITLFSKKELSKDPYININYLKDKLGNAVVEGIRNPIDFTNLVCFKKDKIIYLEFTKNTLLRTDFEKGLDIIEDTCNWAIDSEIMKKEQFIKISFSCFYGEDSLEEKIKEIL